VKEEKPALVVHGHFYQPPRENPWTEKIDRQASAHPHHDWNERIYHESYRPNAYARISDGGGQIEAIVNAYEHLSFNFGPTLLSWLERRHPALLARLQEADRRSLRTRGGHGNAIAQAYGHAILPLCNARDLRTQIRWGVAEFRHRFRRDPESMWLPETAVNEDVVAALIDEGIRFIVLSPYQASRIRRQGGTEWTPLRPGEIDPRVAYSCFHRDGSGRSLVVFFYNGPIAHSIAFEGILHSSRALLDKCLQPQAGPGQIVNVATDGETYGHHYRYGDRCIAHALSVEAAQRGFWITNYGEYLEHHPPSSEVDLQPGPEGEGTSWSCAHGVGRWRRDCGCHPGGQAGWNQSWRGPLRDALDHLRDRTARLFEETRGHYFKDPWEARDAYIALVLDRTRSRREFLRHHAPRELGERDRERALAFLELERNALLMYTSCGWFFSDVSGLETQQILAYAARVISLVEELDLGSVQGPFLEILSSARSNILGMGNGADVYRRVAEVLPVSPSRVAAHLSISSLVDADEVPAECSGFRCQRRQARRQQHGRLVLSTGRLTLESVATGQTFDFAVLALHLGEMDFYAGIKAFPGDEPFAASSHRLWSRFSSLSLPGILRIAQEEFGVHEFGLEHVLFDTRQKIISSVFGSLIERLSQEYGRLYETNQRTLEVLRVSGYELPAELKAVAEFSLGRQFEDEIRRQSGRTDPAVYQRAVDLAQEAARRGYRIDRSFADRLFDEMITEAVRGAVTDFSPRLVHSALSLHQLSRNLLLSPPLDRAQETLFYALEDLTFVSEPVRALAAALGLSSRLLNDPSRKEPVAESVPLLRTTPS
jgi:alpha-amylase/alpha-mannosidase (GH57 family)